MCEAPIMFSLLKERDLAAAFDVVGDLRGEDWEIGSEFVYQVDDFPLVSCLLDVGTLCNSDGCYGAFGCAKSIGGCFDGSDNFDVVGD